MIHHARQTSPDIVSGGYFPHGANQHQFRNSRRSKRPSTQFDERALSTRALLILLQDREALKVGQMCLWNDPTRWEALRSGATCPICVRREPLDKVATLEATWVTMQEVAPIQGYVCLVSQIHAVELHDLTDATAAAFMRDARKVSKALVVATGAVKLNYEIHGNSLPHLHMHFFPRYRGDQFEGQPINPGLVKNPVYIPGEFQRLRDAFLAELSSGHA